MPDNIALDLGVIAGLAGALAPFLFRQVDGAEVAAAVLAILLVASQDASATTLALVALAVFGLQDRWSVPARGGVVLAMALLVGGARPDAAETWLGIAAALAVLAIVPLTITAVDRFRPVPALFVLGWAAAAIYTATPDTEAVTSVGAALGVLAIGHLLSGKTSGFPGIVALSTLLVWATMFDSRGREASFVAILCVGVLLGVPFWFWFRRGMKWMSAPGVILGLAHVGATLALARSAGLQDEIGEALLLAAPIVGGLLVLSALVAWVSPRLEPAP